MDKVSSFEQYKRILAEARDRRWRFSNCYFLPAAAREKIGAGVLSVLRLDDGLLMLEDAGDFYRFHYFLPEEGDPVPPALDKPAVAEFPFAGTLREKQRREIGKLAAMGFRLGRESGQMEAAPEELANPPAPEGIAAVAGQGDAAGVAELLRDSFNPLYAFLPTDGELGDAVREGRVFVVRERGRVAGALVSSFEKEIASIRQVAVAPGGRGRGLGRALTAAYHGHYRGRARRFRHWVDLANAPAVAMYRAFRYDFTVRRANEYVLTNQKGTP